MRQKSSPLLRSKAINLQQLRENLRKTLIAHEIETPGNVSLVLLSHTLKQPKTWVLTHPQHQLTADENHTLEANLKQLLQGVPLPYILGEWAFYGRTFKVTPDVLIPRPETELLVEEAIEMARRLDHPLIVDVGTGSGAIAISLAAELPDAAVIATDLSLQALLVARENAQQHGQRRIAFVCANLLEPFSGRFDLICANLPYIPRPTLDQLSVGAWEPHLALDGGLSGLETIRPLLNQLSSRLSVNGTALFEMDVHTATEALAASKKALPTAHHAIHQDLAGKDRLLIIRRESSQFSD